MLDDHLDKIRDKEKEAAKKILEAKREALDIIDRAHQEGREGIDKVRVEMDEKRREYLSGAEKEAEKKVESMRDRNEHDISALRKRAAANSDRAMKKVMEIFDV
jgi:vacuolar-type H+-ATPase subunit H